MAATPLGRHFPIPALLGRNLDRYLGARLRPCCALASALGAVNFPTTRVGNGEETRVVTSGPAGPVLGALMLEEGRCPAEVLELPMSMYTQLLDAALRQLSIDGSGEDVAVAEVQRYRTQLERATPDIDPDTVSAALALQIGYDVALLRLAELIGIDSDPSRFDRPQLERTRLEDAFAERGISLNQSGESSAESLAG